MEELLRPATDVTISPRRQMSSSATGTVGHETGARRNILHNMLDKLRSMTAFIQFLNDSPLDTYNLGCI